MKNKITIETRSKYAESLAARFRELMDGETQITLAAKLGVSQGNVAKYLQGIIVPRFNVATNAYHNLGINPSWLISGIGEKFIKQQALPKSKIPKLRFEQEKVIKECERKMVKLAEKDKNMPTLVRSILTSLEKVVK